MSRGEGRRVEEARRTTEQADMGETDSAPAAAGERGELVIDEVSHHYTVGRQRIEVLDDVSFRVASGSVTCVVGPSGCGKSTLLSLAAGLQAPAGGSLSWDGRPVELGSNRDMAMAFQQPGLFPWMNVQRNVAIGLETRGQSKREAARRTDEILETVGLAEFKTAYPRQLSGGMAQRVGIARALVLKPRLLLLDEPFAAVDAFTRLSLQQEFKSLLTIDKPTVVFVTHDVPEAIALGNAVVVMTRRPGTVKRIVPIEDEARNRASSAYSHKLAGLLADLGVTDEMNGH